MIEGMTTPKIIAKLLLFALLVGAGFAPFPMNELEIIETPPKDEPVPMFANAAKLAVTDDELD